VYSFRCIHLLFSVPPPIIIKHSLSCPSCNLQSLRYHPSCCLRPFRSWHGMWSTPGVTDLRSSSSTTVNYRPSGFSCSCELSPSKCDLHHWTVQNSNTLVAAVRCVTPNCRLGPLAPEFEFKFTNAQPPGKTTRKLTRPIATRVITHRPTSKKRKEVL
jgi:hypothetical protein